MFKNRIDQYDENRIYLTFLKLIGFGNLRFFSILFVGKMKCTCH